MSFISFRRCISTLLLSYLYSQKIVSFTDDALQIRTVVLYCRKNVNRKYDVRPKFGSNVLDTQLQQCNTIINSTLAGLTSMALVFPIWLFIHLAGPLMSCGSELLWVNLILISIRPGLAVSTNFKRINVSNFGVSKFINVQQDRG